MYYKIFEQNLIQPYTPNILLTLLFDFNIKLKIWVT